MLAASVSRAAIAVESVECVDDGRFINSPHPARVYRNVLAALTPAAFLPARSRRDPAAAFEALFDANGWPPAWRAGLYTMHHYHSSAHEVLGIFSGWVQAQLGGERGPTLTLRAGDVVLLPAGVAHCNLSQSPDFRAVGAYPRGMRVDMRLGRAEERATDQRRLAALPPPAPDPVFGAEPAAGVQPGAA